MSAGCRQSSQGEVPGPQIVEATIDQSEGGAVSTAPVQSSRPSLQKREENEQESESLPDGIPAALISGKAWISCDLDYRSGGDGVELDDLGRQSLLEALADCRRDGVVRLRYRGKIARDFAVLIERITQASNALGIKKRVLDIDSAGGTVEDAIRAGDFIAESHWTIWVREDSICHSACVFVLSGGDARMIAGKVGIHRLIRMSSTATTRIELNAELRAVYQQVKDYLERNGAAVVLADQMMTVPNRSLRLLTNEELRIYGLDGINPAQDDLDRLRLMRKCGEDFVRRRDQFTRLFDQRCKVSDRDIDAFNACGLELRKEFGFPDSSCPAESPMSEFDALGDASVPAVSGEPVMPSGQGGRGESVALFQ
ncbi:MAG: hypothetical protein LBV45_09395 [Xanthomonadaceae bacterium]|jgi:hypothetical protein|nr:hypothetical protein [Xanthomonadaceae bacterium]